MSTPRNGAEAACAALRSAGVDTVFGLPGTQTVALYEALRRSELRTVSTTSETAAAFMAQGFYRASGRLAAVSAIPGPGLAFTLPALAEASLDSAALVVLTGTPPASADGRRRSQAIDQRAIAAPLAKAVLDVDSAADAQAAVAQACALALRGEPGPVLVQFAPRALTDAAGAVAIRPPDGRSSVTDPERLREAARFAAGARRVLIFAGQGAAAAAHELGTLVNGLGALIATTPSGRGVLREDDARVLPFDASGDAAALAAIAAECDAIVALGAGLAEGGSGGFALQFAPERLVRVDTSPHVLARPPAAKFMVESTAEEFVAATLAELARLSPGRGAGFDAEAARAARMRFRERRLDTSSEPRVAGGSAVDFFGSLRRALPDDTCLVLDSGQHQLLARRHFGVLAARGLVFPSDFQSMGFGLPAAIGAKLAQPERAVVALVGDGGLAMTGLELLTAVRVRLPLPVIVFDDGALGLIRLDQLLTHGRSHGTELGGLDFEALADAVGCGHVRVGLENAAEAVRTALEAQGPTLIAVPVGDAPALVRARRRLVARKAAKSVLGSLGLLRRRAQGR